ncbi:hypothetical protein CYMTET_27152, partial [Cymbomonas tetramitiformis]
EWLWCESWCGDATKSKARTIDLCNNPMTKEPKLDMARRIVGEWSDYDEVVRGLTERVEAMQSGDTGDAAGANIVLEDATPAEQVSEEAAGTADVPHSHDAEL